MWAQKTPVSEVIIDWVPNHSPWDWTDVVQFDYSKRGLRDYMIETFKFWINETKLDGFRMDVAHQIPIDFWNEIRQPLLELKPGLAHRLEFFVKDSIPWKEHKFNILYTRLNRLKKNNPALWNPGFRGEMVLMNNNHPDKVLSFMRKKGENEILVILNLSDTKLEIELESFKDPEVFTDFQSGETVSFATPVENIPAWGYIIYYK